MLLIMNIRLLFVMLCFISSFAHAARGSLTMGLVRIEPVISAEREQRFYPTEHTQDSLLYGGRLLIGPQSLKLESEYLIGHDSESFPDENLKVKTDTERMKIGLRSGFSLGKFFSWFLRGGMQGKSSKTKTVHTDDDTTENKSSAFYADPYLGTGFRFHLLQNLSTAGDITAIFSDRPNKGDRDYQASLGFSISI